MKASKRKDILDMARKMRNQSQIADLALALNRELREAKELIKDADDLMRTRDKEDQVWRHRHSNWQVTYEKMKEVDEKNNAD